MLSLFPYKSEGGVNINGERVIYHRISYYFGDKKCKSQLNYIVYKLAKDFDANRPIDSLFESASKLTGHSVKVLFTHFKKNKESWVFSWNPLTDYWDSMKFNDNDKELIDIVDSYIYFLRTEIYWEKKNFVNAELQAKKYLKDIVIPKLETMMGSRDWYYLEVNSCVLSQEEQDSLQSFKKEDWKCWFNWSRCEQPLP